MTAKSRADLQTDINTLLADNVNGDIDAADIRAVLSNIIDSCFVGLSDKGTSSGAVAIVSGSSINFAHNLSVEPNLFVIKLVCISNNRGYVVGDEIFDLYGGYEDGQNRGVSIQADATNVNVAFSTSSSVFTGLNKTTNVRQTLGNSNWTVEVLPIAL